MRKPVLWVAGTLILGFAAGWVLAQEQGDSNNKQAGNETTTKAIRPNIQSQGPSVQAGDANQQEEQSRKQAEEMVRKLTEQRRQELKRRQDTIRAGSEARYRMPNDANAPMERRGEPNSRGRQGPVGQLGAKNAPPHRLAIIEQQISYEETKHRDRLARLNRIGELAKQQGNTEIVARVDKLLAEEQQLYNLNVRRMEHRKNALAGYSEKQSPDKGGNRNMDSNNPAAGDK